MAGIYIHIPFCEKKCGYCDFYSITDLNKSEDFIRALLNEIKINSRDKEFPLINTIYFGGGTPSLLPKEMVFRILEEIYKNYKITENPEVTLEANPNSLTKSSLNYYLKSGINRLSIGIQSFIDEELNLLGRIHNREEAINSFYLARESGFKNISIDLIYAIPFSNIKNWEYNLNKAQELKPEHISAYSLIYEKGTEIYKKYEHDANFAIQEEIEADMYLWAMEFLESKGFIHYEVSNYALPGFESIHNSNYWNHEQYIGLGPSSHSLIDNQRRWNYKDLNRYISLLDNNVLPVESSENLDAQILISEKIFLGLRSKGINLKQLKTQFNYDLLSVHQNKIWNLVKEKYIRIENETLVLTNEGFLICDEICKMLM